ncbi:MAG: LamG domain-containing protein, partial [Bacteroidetes bacterium]|nr:LamG domain-containing protein [Bacteroidota bacterium]
DRGHTGLEISTPGSVGWTIDDLKIWPSVLSPDDLAKEKKCVPALPGSARANYCMYFDFSEGFVEADNHPAFNSNIVCDDNSYRNSSNYACQNYWITDKTNRVNGYLGNFNMIGGPMSNYVMGIQCSECYTEGTNIPAGALSLKYGDYVEIAKPYQGFENKISVSFWLRLDENPQTGAGIGQGGANLEDNAKLMWTMHLANGGINWNVIKNDGTGMYPDGGLTFGMLPDNKPLADGNWHHIAGTVSPDNTILYIDGEVADTKNGLGTNGLINLNPNSVMHIGKDVRYASGRFMDGAFDDLRIYKNVLSSDDVKAIYINKCELSTSDEDLIGYYTFNQGNVMSNNNVSETTLNCSSIVTSAEDLVGVLHHFNLCGSVSNWIQGYITNGKTCE